MFFSEGGGGEAAERLTGRRRDDLDALLTTTRVAFTPPKIRVAFSSPSLPRATLRDPLKLTGWVRKLQN